VGFCIRQTATKKRERRERMASKFEWFASLTILVVLVLVWIECSEPATVSWPRRASVPETPLASLRHFRSGDILLLEQPYPLTGHLALVVQAPRYGQLFVWEMPNPLRRAPDLLKPLACYLRACFKKKTKVYVQHLVEGPYVDLFPCVRSLSARLHYDFLPVFLYCNRVLCGDVLGLPGLPPSVFKVPQAKDLSHCTKAVTSVLVQTKILSPEIFAYDDIFVPMTLLDPAFDMQRYTLPPYRYAELTQLSRS
jgi:hypothetical protein